MRLLLDTHALVWWWIDDPRLPQMARTAIAEPENTIVVSAASAWEIATKHGLGKWPEVAGIIDAFESNVLRSRFASLAIGVRHARLAGLLEGQHRDPFDRMLIAQARAEGMPIVSRDQVFHDYGVAVVWDAG